MRNRYNVIYGLVAFALLSVCGCSKQSDIVAPSPSTITVDVLPSETVLTGNQVEIRAVVMDGENYSNDVGVRFISNNAAVASFSSTAAVDTTSASTDSNGVATVTVYALSAGTADISADITATSAKASLTVN